MFLSLCLSHSPFLWCFILLIQCLSVSKSESSGLWRELFQNVLLPPQVPPQSFSMKKNLTLPHFKDIQPNVGSVPSPHFRVPVDGFFTMNSSFHCRRQIETSRIFIPFFNTKRKIAPHIYIFFYHLAHHIQKKSFSSFQLYLPSYLHTVRVRFYINEMLCGRKKNSWCLRRRKVLFSLYNNCTVCV